MVIRKLKNRTGFTLAEVSVVIVLVALLATLAISVLTLVNNRQKDAKDEVVADNELYCLETAYLDWVGLFDSSGCTFGVSANGDKITATETDTELTMTFEGGKLTYYETSDSPKVLTFDDITDIKFDTCADNIIRCTAVTGGKEYKILYCVRAAKL